jgi:hypothetical protein
MSRRIVVLDLERAAAHAERCDPETAHIMAEMIAEIRCLREHINDSAAERNLLRNKLNTLNHERGRKS